MWAKNLKNVEQKVKFLFYKISGPKLELKNQKQNKKVGKRGKYEKEDKTKNRKNTRNIHQSSDDWQLC